jgi:SNF2 family DNA or RNA helicase
MKEYINILQAIMRLRQICCHRALLANEVGTELTSSDSFINKGNSQSEAINIEDLDPQVKKPLSARQAYQIFELMKEAGETICVGCRRKDISLIPATGEKDPSATKQILGYLTPCAHPLCHSCVQRFKCFIPGFREGIVACCPVCGSWAEMRMFELKERESVEVRRAIRRKLQFDGSEGIEPSSKLRVLIGDLEKLHERSKELNRPLKRYLLL